MKPSEVPHFDQGKPDPTRITEWQTAARVASAYLSRGSLSNSVSHAERALEIATENFPRLDGRWNEVVLSVAPILSECGRIEQAVGLIEEGIGKQLELGADNVDALVRLKCLAGVIRFENDEYPEARDYYESALHDCNTSLDQSNERKGSVLMYLAPAQFALADQEGGNRSLTEAVYLMRIVQPVSLESFGQLSLQTASSLNSLKLFDEACQILEAAIPRFDEFSQEETLLAEPHVKRVAQFGSALKGTLANYYAKRGMENEAITSLNASFENDMELTPERGLSRAKYAAHIYETLGRPERAEEFLQDQIAEAQGQLEDKADPRLAPAFIALASVKLSQAHYLDSLKFVEVGMQLLANDRENTPVQKAPLFCDALLIQGSAELSLGKRELSLTHMEKAYRDLGAIPGISPKQLGTAAMKVAQVKLAVGDLEEAESLIDKATQVFFPSSLRKQNFQYAMCLQLKASLLGKRGETNEVGELLTQAEEAMDAASGNTPQVPHIRLYSDIGAYHRDSDELGLGVEYYERALKLAEQLNRRDDPIFLQVAHGLTELYRIVGENDLADELDERVKRYAEELDLMNDGMLFSDFGDPEL